MTIPDVGVGRVAALGIAAAVRPPKPDLVATDQRAKKR